jgi:transposase InsO family protein
MPWKETGPVLERMQFIEDYLSGFYTITELALRYGVSRRIAHKWLSRHDEDGAKGLTDRSRAPLSIPHRTSGSIAAKVIAFRERFPHMGPRKIAVRLAELHPQIDWPAPSTIGDILKRANLVTGRPRRNRPMHPLRLRGVPTQPNDLMTVDYKGEFLLGNHRYCYPLTIVDHVSRYILACEGFHSTQQAHTRKVFERVFREYGLPRAILSDNGSPFGSPGLARLSRLSLWWIRLGVSIERITPGHPEQNGAHERMHRTLKAETTRPPEANLVRQQARFDCFRHEFNSERPHETLGQKRPVTIYTRVSRDPPADRIRRSSRDAEGRSQRHDPLEERTAVPEPHPARRNGRPRRDRRRCVVALLWTGSPGAIRRAGTALLWLMQSARVATAEAICRRPHQLALEWTVCRRYSASCDLSQRRR